MTIENLINEATGLLKELISIESFSTQENKTADALQNFFERHGVKTFRKGNNVWAKNKYFDSTKPTILLNSHHDTVKPNASWTLNPFQSIVKDEKLFGLGSNDAGGALVSIIATFLYFNENKNLKYNFIIAGTAEEENSGKGGVELMRDEIGKIDFAIVGEPTEMKMAVAEKGLMVLDCIAKGKAGHAARDIGENAIVSAIKDIEWFHSYQFDKVSETLGPIKMTCTIINSGSQHNVIPDICKFTVDVRTTEVHLNEVVLETIRANVKSKVTPRSTRLQPSGIDKNQLLVKTAKKLRIEIFGSATTSDMALWKVPAVKMGPGKSERSHTADEFIYLKEIEEGIKIYIKLLEEIVL
ncbi:MAG: M20 family metallo-hydrolase [Bacteroidetes bacterium]|nr:M20 family metallo-hydrolase [Bacteroidota bacterium]